MARLVRRCRHEGGGEQTQTIEPRRGTGGSLPKGGAPWAMDVVVRLRVVVRCLWGLIDIGGR